MRLTPETLARPELVFAIAEADFDAHHGDAGTFDDDWVTTVGQVLGTLAASPQFADLLAAHDAAVFAAGRRAQWEADTAAVEAAIAKHEIEGWVHLHWLDADLGRSQPDGAEQPEEET